MAPDGLQLSAGHPLMEELSSLRAAVARFQNEAHTSALKLQHHALDTSALSERVAHLEAENARLRTELGVLRSSPLPSSSSVQDGAAESPDTVAELTLSLRRLSAKLTLTESSLAEHTLALSQSNTLAAEKTRAAHEAYALAARARGREEEGVLRIQELERAVREEREKGAMSERAVSAYAELVRGLEGRSPPPSAASSSSFTLNGNGGEDTSPGGPAADLAASQSQLTAFSASFASTASALEKRVFALESELQVAEAQLSAARALNVELGEALAGAKFEGERARVDDKSAAGMVERYMRIPPSLPTRASPSSHFRAMNGARHLCGGCAGQPSSGLTSFFPSASAVVKGSSTAPPPACRAPFILRFAHLPSSFLLALSSPRRVLESFASGTATRRSSSCTPCLRLQRGRLANAHSRAERADGAVREAMGCGVGGGWAFFGAARCVVCYGARKLYRSTAYTIGRAHTSPAVALPCGVTW
ncbi:hypothetical protein FB451DRAFT_1402498 [Mycena latifolia]|nr:hypothetical protein FB451DRAFT_1402498 [Mycena latifolia]